MAESEDYPVQEHELPGLGRKFSHELAEELGRFSTSPLTARPQPVWVLSGLHAAQEELAFQTARWALKARDTGSSWSQIGEALGMTKQAAQQRFGGKPE